MARAHSRILFLLALVAVAGTALSQQRLATPPATEPGGAAAPATRVRKLLDRASREPAGAAIRSLDQAAKLASGDPEAVRLLLERLEQDLTAAAESGARWAEVPLELYFGQPAPAAVRQPLAVLGGRAVEAAERLPAEQMQTRASLFRLAGRLLSAGARPEEAIRAAARALEARQADPDAVLLAELHAAARQHAEALAVLERQVRQPGNHWEAALRLLEMCATPAERQRFRSLVRDPLAGAPETVAIASRLSGIGIRSLEEGDLESAREFHTRALAILENLAPGSLDAAAALNNLGALLLNEGNLLRAREHFERALAIQEKLAPGSLAVAGTLYNLGGVLGEQGDLLKAREHLERALEIRERHAPDSLALADSLNGLGIIHDAQGNLTRAREHYQRALALYAKHAPDSLNVADALNNLGIISYRQGDLRGAREQFERAFAIREKRSPGSLAVASSLANIGALLREQGDRVRAREHFERALAIHETLAPDSLLVAGSCHNLAIVSLEQGDLIRAREYLERALAVREKLAPGSLDVAATLVVVGALHEKLGDLQKALEHLQRALAINEKHAPDSLHVARTLNSLGVVARNRGELATARNYLERALAIQQKHAPDSLEVAASLTNLGNVHQQLGDLDRARECHEHALALKEKQAPDSPTVAISLTNLGTVYRDQGNLREARELQERALAIEEKHAPGAPSLIYPLVNLAGLLDESGDARAAEVRLRQALAIIDQKVPRSLTIPETLRLLARLLLEKQDPAARTEAQEHLKRAARIAEAVSSLPRGPVPQGEAQSGPLRPEVRFLSPETSSVVAGETVEVTVALVSPVPLARCRVWINGRPFGGEHGFDLPGPEERGRLLGKGRLLAKGRILAKGEERGQVARELEAAGAGAREAAELVKRPEHAHYQELRLSLPVEDTDGEFLRIAVQVATTGGMVSDRQILALRRPEAEQARGSLRVLAIGVSDYLLLPKLKYAARDARELGIALEAQGGPDRLYRGADVTFITDADATLARIQEALDQFTRNVRPGDTLILALSGHGIKAGAEFYFAPVRFDPENAAGTGLAWGSVLARLEAARRTAKAVWLLADCCRAAPGLRRESVATARDLKRGTEEGGNLVICTASSGDNPSYESEDLQQGLFTHAWLEALRGEAPAVVYEETARGRVLTLSGLQFAVTYSLTRHARRAGVRQQVEFPRLEGSFSPNQPVFVPLSKPLGN